jgi:hypothetical protein
MRDELKTENCLSVHPSSFRVHRFFFIPHTSALVPFPLALRFAASACIIVGKQKQPNIIVKG